VVKLATGLLIVALVLGFARLCTGLVYAYDAETSYFVLKHTPSLTIERRETLDRPVTQDIVLDDDEMQVPYGELYIGVMRLVPALVIFLLAAAGILFFMARQRQSPASASGRSHPS
jgi:hypothetical protein